MAVSTPQSDDDLLESLLDCSNDGTGMNIHPRTDGAVPSNTSWLRAPSADVRELSRLESAISGILAGFALTIVVLLIQQQANITSATQYEPVLGQAAIATFIVVFFTSLLASLLLAFSGSEQGHIGREFTLNIVTGAVFGLSIILLMFGLILVIRSFKLVDILPIAKLVMNLTIGLALMHSVTGVLNAIAIISRVSTNEVVRSKRDLMILMSSAGLPPICALILRQLSLYEINIPSSAFDKLPLSSTIFSTVCGGYTAFRSRITPQTRKSFWWLVLLVFLFSLLSAWTILCTPD